MIFPIPKLGTKIKLAFATVLPGLLLLTLILSAQTASATAFSVTPSDPNLRLFNLTIDPGTETQAAVLIENNSNEPTTVSVYGADGTQSNQGTFALTTLASEQKHVGLWVTPANDTVTIEARQSKEVGFKIQVPADATPGVYSGGIAVEESRANANDPNNINGGNSISISARIVVKLFVTVPGEKINNYEWSGFSYENANSDNPGSFNLSYKNTGNTIITADQQVEIKGFPGKEQSFSPTSALLLQGSDVQIPLKWTDEPFFGFYTATATVTFSEFDITSNTKINGKTETKTISIYVPLKTDTTEGKIVIAIAALIVWLIIIMIIILLLKLSFRKKCNPYLVLEGDTITSIAENCKVNWKKLAKVNKLKAPYTIKPGQKILAPQKKE